MSRALKQEDERELSKLYEAEFNQPGLHDRVLIFDVVASWPPRPLVANVEENETSEASDQSDDGSQETDMNSSDESETESQDCVIASKYANG